MAPRLPKAHADASECTRAEGEGPLGDHPSFKSNPVDRRQRISGVRRSDFLSMTAAGIG